ncbi:MAG: aldehyde dehydrogenase family protein, partial [Devosia sp.]|uniref:aldehyde dehydrogenase family protein n=1 Tax=Devosia sp. TaxID=1871048 RepID=UPI001AC452DB
MSTVVETHTDIVPRLEAAAERVQRAHKAAATVIFGQDQVIERTLITILSGGHALLIGVPGLAKTLLVETLGTMSKSVSVGNAARNGMLSALLAKEGLAGPDAPLEGQRGFLAVACARADTSCITEGLGREWALLSNTYKPYPCGIVAHPAIDGGLALSTKIADVSAIEAITLRCHPLVPELMGNPQPADGLQARFSAIHGVAAALCDGQVGLAQYEDGRVVRDDVKALRAKTTLAPLSSEKAANDLKEQIRQAVAHGARAEEVGPAVPNRGAFVQPTILTEVHEDNPARYWEFFGPVSLLFRAKDEDDAVRIANDSPFGLGGSV